MLTPHPIELASVGGLSIVCHYKTCLPQYDRLRFENSVQPIIIERLTAWWNVFVFFSLFNNICLFMALILDHKLLFFDNAIFS